MVKYECKGCGAMTSNPEMLCQRCRGLVKLIRQIKAMLKPYSDLKKELQKRQLWEVKKAEAEREKNGD